jgi:hypothetical protein
LGTCTFFPSDNSPAVFKAHISLAVNLDFPMLQYSSSSWKHPRRRRRSPLFSSWMQTRKSLGSQSMSKETLLLGGNGESKSKRKNWRWENGRRGHVVPSFISYRVTTALWNCTITFIAAWLASLATCGNKECEPSPH